MTKLFNKFTYNQLLIYKFILIFSYFQFNENYLHQLIIISYF